MKSDGADFAASVERWILEQAHPDGPRTFDELVCRLPGVYPTDVREGLNRVIANCASDAQAVERLTVRGHVADSTQARPSPLPVPHPLDYDWRFSESAVNRLVEECERRSGGQQVVLLGAPSVLWALRERSSVSGVLLDANPAAIESLAGQGAYRAELCDVGDGILPSLEAPLLVLDPPWYVDQEKLFLWAASRLCSLGGSVLVSLPGEGTRPGVREETKQLLAWARELGFEIEAYEPGVLTYRSPPFERNALTAVGLSGMPLEWRRGDLASLRLTAHTGAPQPRMDRDDRWPEVSFGQVRVRLRPCRPSFPKPIEPQLRSIVAGDVLDSVSRRDPRRNCAALWTSGNRIFGSGSIFALQIIAAAIAASEPPEGALADIMRRHLTALERRNVAATVEQLEALVAMEATELRAMGWAA